MGASIAYGRHMLTLPAPATAQGKTTSPNQHPSCSRPQPRPCHAPADDPETWKTPSAFVSRRPLPGLLEPSKQRRARPCGSWPTVAPHACPCPLTWLPTPPCVLLYSYSNRPSITPQRTGHFGRGPCILMTMMRHMALRDSPHHHCLFSDGTWISTTQNAASLKIFPSLLHPDVCLS
ncbi:hypothetical protein DM02DRAFT_301180 [Periconia macrospinosa]|uniref:Uncharacterized protein n=1 Tax=Periconia macrospinosa TaxID=97972 RepID=A0A2V1DZ37_9PLEO|nr:hypothetical protein DM02DRAFT_301180 [Periconia macrospinosa]